MVPSKREYFMEQRAPVTPTERIQLLRVSARTRLTRDNVAPYLAAPVLRIHYVKHLARAWKTWSVPIGTIDVVDVGAAWEEHVTQMPEHEEDDDDDDDFD